MRLAALIAASLAPFIDGAPYNTGVLMGTTLGCGQSDRQLILIIAEHGYI
jgi:hypothetical protein